MCLFRGTAHAIWLYNGPMNMANPHPKRPTLSAVLTKNATSACKGQKSSESSREISLAYNSLCCQNVSNYLVSGNIAHLGEFHSSPYSSVSIKQTTAENRFYVSRQKKTDKSKKLNNLVSVLSSLYCWKKTMNITGICISATIMFKIEATYFPNIAEKQL